MADYYVATNGNDGGAGTLASPWLTITYGYAQMSAGDTLYIRGGTYIEALAFNTNGTSGNEYNIEAYQSENVIIDGEAGVGGLNEGLPAGSIIATDPVSGRGYKYEGLVTVKGNYTNIVGLEVKRSMGRGYNINDCTNVNVTGGSVHHSRLGNILVYLDTTTVVIDGVEVYMAGEYAQYSRGSLTWPMAINMRGNFMTVRNCTIYNNWAEGLGAGKYANDVTFEDNILYDNYAVIGIYLDHAQDVLVQRNIVYQSTDTAFYRSGEPAEGIAVNNESDLASDYCSGITIINNLVLGCKWNIGLWAQGTLYGTSDMVVAHNTCIEGTLGGMRVQDANSINHSTVRFKNNIFYQTSGVCVSIASPPGVTFTSNLWFNQTPVDADAQDGGDITTDPLLLLSGSIAPGSLTSTHFKIIAGSPAIGAATEDGDSPAADYFEVTRSDDDIGAHEYVSAGSIKFGSATLTGVGTLAGDAGISGASPTALDRAGLALTLVEKDERILTLE